MAAKLWTVAEAAEYLSLSTMCVRDMVKKGELPHLRLRPRTIRFDPDCLTEWAKSRQANRSEAVAGVIGKDLGPDDAA